MAITNWTAALLPDLTGKTFIVTGATSGLGKASADTLARAGARRAGRAHPRRRAGRSGRHRGRHRGP
jgi:NAD(P)-dependent dehydrogenase (short-subunit alcohol dehydrogenase family)